MLLGLSSLEAGVQQRRSGATSTSYHAFGRRYSPSPYGDARVPLRLRILRMGDFTTGFHKNTRTAQMPPSIDLVFIVQLVMW